MKDYQCTNTEKNSHAFRDGRVYKQTKRQQRALLQPFQKHNIEHPKETNTMDNYEAPGLAQVVVDMQQSTFLRGDYLTVLDWYRKVSVGYLNAAQGQIERDVAHILRGEFHKLHPTLKRDINSLIQFRVAQAIQLQEFAKTLDQD